MKMPRERYVAFINLGRAYKVDRNVLWYVLQVYGVGGKLLRTVKISTVCAISKVRHVQE